jgi:outer membrane protein
MDRNLAETDGTAIHIDRNMWGPALQAGVDVNLQDKWLVNFDVKKIWFNTDVYTTANGAKIDSLDIDPWVVSFGVGKKF